MTTDKKEWDKLDSESAPAYAAFCVFAELPPASRSLEAAYKAHKPGAERASGRWQQWSRDHDWRARADARDREMMRLAEAGSAAHSASVKIRRAVLVDKLLRIVDTRIEEATAEPGSLTTPELIRLVSLVLDATKADGREEIRIEHVSGGSTSAAKIEEELAAGTLTPADMVRRYQELVGDSK